MLLSWTMLMAGATSFTSCDEEEENEGATIIEKYKNQKGATIEGDEVIHKEGNTVTIYHFSGDKIDKAIAYRDCGTKEAAQEAYEAAKAAGLQDVKIEGSIVSASSDELLELYEDYSFTKEDFCKYLNGDKSAFVK